MLTTSEKRYVLARSTLQQGLLVCTIYRDRNTIPRDKSLVSKQVLATRAKQGAVKLLSTVDLNGVSIESIRISVVERLGIADRGHTAVVTIANIVGTLHLS